jgi:signal transduction histidine kinase
VSDKAPNPCLLIVDDDESLGRTLQGILRRAGYDGQWVASGEQALRLVESQKADHSLQIVLIDVRLPDMNGVEVLRAVRQTHPDIGAIMMTGHVDVDAAIGALNEGAFAYLQKPYNIDEVKVSIARLMEKQKLVKENAMLVKQLQEANLGLEAKVQERTEDIKNVNLSLVATIQKLQKANEAKSQFVSMVSHELRTPMTIILGFAEHILMRFDGMTKDAMLGHLQTIRRDALRLTRLISDALDLSRLQQDELTLTFASFDLKTLVEETVKGLESSANGVAIRVSIADGDWKLVSDKSKVNQILLNLLGNAVKYSPKDAAVRVEATRISGGVKVSVADAGPGIAEANQEKIFEAFFRTPDEVNMRSPGTGLGLTIAKALVGSLGGRIELTSAVGAGSAFSFTLPLNPPAPSQEETNNTTKGI